MKRDMDLIRKLLIRLESIKNEDQARAPLAVEGYTKDQIGYHKYLLVDAGFAAGYDVTHDGSFIVQFELSHLTWDGQEFLAAARDETRWVKARKMGEAVGGVGVTVLKQVLVKLALEQLG